MRARSRTDSREKMRPGSSGLLNRPLTPSVSPSSRVRTPATLSILYIYMYAYIYLYLYIHILYIYIYMIHLREISGAQWPPCDDPKGRTLSRSLKCRYICRRRMSRHKISTRRRRRLALISLGCVNYLLHTYKRACTYIQTNKQTYTMRDVACCPFSIISLHNFSMILSFRH